MPNTFPSNNETITQSYNGTDARIFVQLKSKDYWQNKQGEPYHPTTSFQRLRGCSTLSISSTITVVPIRTGGNDSPVTTVRGFRTIAGTFVFIDTFKDAFGDILMEYYQNIDNVENTTIKDTVTHNSFWYDTFPSINILIVVTDKFSDNTKLVAMNDIQLRDVGTTLSIYDLYTERTITYVGSNIVTTLTNTKYDSNKEGSVDLGHISSIYNNLIGKAGGGEEISSFANKGSIAIRDLTKDYLIKLRNAGKIE